MKAVDVKNLVTKSMPFLTTGLLVAVASSQAFSASIGSLVLTGTVSDTVALVVTANGTNNTTMNIVGGESAKNVASVAETSNDLAGYHIQMSSANGGELRLNGTSSTYKTTYQVSYDGASYFTPSSTLTTIKNVASLTGNTTHNSAVLVDVVAYAAAPEGTYSDTLTFTITDNE